MLSGVMLATETKTVPSFADINAIFVDRSGGVIQSLRVNHAPLVFDLLVGFSERPIQEGVFRRGR
jgi:hypothetical protein